MTTHDNWQKSSFSGFGDGNDCVELSATPDDIHLRESDTPTTVIATTRAPLAHLLHAITGGRLTPPPAALRPSHNPSAR
ncbi:DUF397 domain-containing protein [Streptomyces caniscabiei]|uniref:DUF397 domain-containing protein n=1 Tax=Streptomyces caniscabiei TaxID=2746961 RepID=UPI000765CF90|nr:DUF397 domain-containing protein [Streptomyces caniscabiei]